MNFIRKSLFIKFCYFCMVFTDLHTKVARSGMYCKKYIICSAVPLYKLSLDARKRASRWNVCGSHGDVHSIYGSASPIIAEQNPVPSIFCVPDAPDRKVCPRSPTEVGYPVGLPVSIPRNRRKEKREIPLLIYRPFAARPAARRERSRPWGGAASICRRRCAPASAPVRRGRCRWPSRPAWSIAG